MLCAFTSFSASQSEVELVPAVEGKIIRVLKLLLTASALAGFELLSDPGGGGLAALAPPIHLTGSFALRLGRPYAFSAARGKGLGLNLTFASTEGPAGIAVWYELVD
jgi:hypothetical protein